MSSVDRLRRLLGEPGLLVVPGAFDAHSARLIERAGFPAVYLSGFGTSASRIGAPDAGLLSFAEMAAQATAVAAAVDVPVIADADTGYGGPGNLRRTVRSYARAGVAAIQIEDQVWPKRCGHTEGKRVVDRREAGGRVRAAAESRDAEHDVLIVARTDARATHGPDEAVARCNDFADAGADLVFPEALGTTAEMERFNGEVRAPSVVNVLEGGCTPVLGPEEYARLGFAVAIYPLTLLYAATHAMQQHLREFAPWSGPLDFEGLTEAVGFPQHDAWVERFGPEGGSE